ncbi:Alpha-L-iduronidase [Araneus ventricosus]|uniref:Alpha-L-iduronidase n=1 Tax=Araneus ventricosus TaxID=182803 RepID=A0A4Y2N9C0_ARAVE|nr:Alpha-L-iduronidase [Araneus ventricosus]
MISAIDRKEQLQVSVLNAIFYIDRSWNMVSQKTIANCFRHAGFHSSPESEELLEDDDEDLPLTELAEKLRNHGYAIPDENLYTKIDEDLATKSEASIQDIVSNVLNSNAEGSDDEDDSECEKKSVSTSDALKAIDDLGCFFTNSEAADEHLKAIRDLEKVVLTTKKNPHEESYNFLLSPDMKLNIFHIGSLPRNGISQVRIHWMLDLVQMRVSHFKVEYDFSRLDKLIYLLWENDLHPGFELMGNPSSYFTDFENETQVYLWKDLINKLAVHYIDMFGFLNYYDACSEGLFSANKHLRFGGPGGSCRIPTKGHSPMCWALLHHCSYGKNYFTGKKGVRLDFISFHKKGNGGSNLIIDEEIETIHYILSNFPSYINTSFYNDEADPLKNWSLPQWWRADSTYAAMVIKIILNHIYFYYVEKGSDLVKDAKFNLLSNDNAFLSYFPNQFTERTLLARFQVNNTYPKYVEFIRKPVYAVFGLLSKLCPNILSINLTNGGGDLLNNWGSNFGALATHCVAHGEISIILYNSADTFKNGSVANVDVYLNISCLKENTSARWAILEVNNRKSNPYLVWKNIGMPSYPSVEDFSLMKSKEEPYMRGPWDFPDSLLWKYQLNVLNPGITLIHICERPQKLYKVKNIRFLQVWNKTLQISWTDQYNRCLSSYIVLYSFDLYGSYDQLNKKRLLFPSYWHACYSKKIKCDIRGFYKVFAVDYWGRRGPSSESFQFKG